MILKQSKSTGNTRFSSNFILSILNSRKILIFISLLHLLGLPVLAALAILEFHDAVISYDTQFAFILISVFCLGAAVLCGIFIAMSNFSYLYKKSQVDMVYALPIRRHTKFLSDYASGAAVYLVPYIIACIIADLIIILGLINVSYLSDEIISVYQIMPLILQCELAGLIAMLMFYTLSVMAMCCCGTLFESIMNILLINAVIPGAIAVVAGLFFTGLYGVPIINTVIPVMTYSSPVGATIFLVKSVEHIDGMNEILSISAVSYGKWLILFTLFTAAYFLLAMFLCKKRKAEDTSKPYVFKFLYYILITVVTMAISLIARIEDDMIIPVIVFSLIIYMILEIITNRGFRKIYKSFIKYAVTMVCITAVCAAASLTHGFGVEGKTYSPSRISSVELSYDGFDTYLTRGHNYFTFDDMFDDLLNYSTLNIKYTDKGIIQTVLNVQKQAIDLYRSNKYQYESHLDYEFNTDYYYPYDDDDDSYDFPLYDVSFKFNLKTGGSITRNYTLNYEQLKQLSILDSTEELADYRKEVLKRLMQRDRYVGPDGKDVRQYEIRYSLLYNMYDDVTVISVSDDEAEEFAECYRQDLLETSSDEFTSEKIVCYLYSEFPVRENYKRTISFIQNKSKSNKIPSVSECIGDRNGILYQPKGYKSWGRDDITATFGMGTPLNGYSHILTSAQTAELMKYARGQYIEYADCYVLKFDDYFYVIPSEYSGIAEKIYNDVQVNTEKYTFGEFMSAMKSSEAPYDFMEKYLYDYPYCNESYYSDIEYIFYHLRDADEYAPGMEEDKRAYDLLKKFFGCYSLNDYINNSENGADIESEMKDWNEYTDKFPEISKEELGFYTYLQLDHTSQ